MEKHQAERSQQVERALCSYCKDVFLEGDRVVRANNLEMKRRSHGYRYYRMVTLAALLTLRSSATPHRDELLGYPVPES